VNKETIVNEGKNFCLIREELIDQFFDYLVGHFPFEIWQRGGTSLSIGCGKGREVFQLERHGFQVTACDISQNSLREGWRLGYFSSQTRVVWDDYKSCLNGQRYGFIIALHVLPGLCLKKLISDCSPSLEDGGVMIVSGGDEKIKEFEGFFCETELPEVKKLTMVSGVNSLDRRVLIIEIDKGTN